MARYTVIITFTLLISSLVCAQEKLLVPPEYLPADYTAPQDAPSSVVLAGPDEPGERLVVTGRVIYGSTPVAGVSIYVFQTDASGNYAPGLAMPEAELYPRLHGALRSDAEGWYKFETVRPGSYDDGAAHVHYVVKAEGYKSRLFDLWFQDDPILVELRSNGEPQIPKGIRTNVFFLEGQDHIAIRPVVRDAAGTWHAVRDLDMIPE